MGRIKTHEGSLLKRDFSLGSFFLSFTVLGHVCVTTTTTTKYGTHRARLTTRQLVVCVCVTSFVYLRSRGERSWNIGCSRTKRSWACCTHLFTTPVAVTTGGHTAELREGAVRPHGALSACGIAPSKETKGKVP